ncbi:hypothetical protein GQ600_7863 [Phytophthora cactorum]|nr:hypothetical protein GQ600_7863 [Phytophthora cactorum]
MYNFKLETTAAFNHLNVQLGADTDDPLKTLWTHRRMQNMNSKGPGTTYEELKESEKQCRAKIPATSD